ncbi:hypothetical protein ACFVY1_28455 [Streptomyces sp. NPDC058293]|uniref:hypothetical protein n=1 Tax=Streptomyces sp. NPDC058293 TaxID=3346429 RepID=UPI0036E8E43C
MLLHPRGLAPRIVNLDEWAWHVIDGLRDESVRNSNRALTELVPNWRTWCRTGPDRPVRTTSASPSRCGCVRSAVSCAC